MALIQLNRHPSRRQLRQFAGLWFPAFCALVGLLLWKGTDALVAALAVWIAAGVVSVVGFVVPAFMRVVWVAVMVVFYPVGWCVSHLLLALVYFGLITPIGLGLRLFGRDALQRRFEPQAGTYWSELELPGGTARYFRQF